MRLPAEPIVLDPRAWSGWSSGQVVLLRIHVAVVAVVWAIASAVTAGLAWTPGAMLLVGAAAAAAIAPRGVWNARSDPARARAMRFRATACIGVALVACALAFPGAESLGRLVPALVVGLSLLLPTRPPAAGSSPRIAFVLLAASAFLVLVLLLRAPAADTIAALGVLVVVDPVFVRARRDGTPARLFYDGECGFCHGWVRLAAQEDAAGVFRFAPLFGATFDERFPGERAKEVPEGIVLVLADDSVLTRSDAALRAAAMLGGWWRVLAWLGRVLPKPLRELGYGAVARVRRRLAPKPTGACPMLPPELAARFDP